MRLFVAVQPAAEAVDDLSRLVANLAVGQPAAPGRSTRLAPSERWHLTLAFLGEVDEAREPAVRAALGTVAEAWRADDRPTPVLRLAGGGRFGRGRFTVMWAGLRGDLDALGALAKSVRAGLRGARLPYDRKPFRPHLTLARPGDRLTAEQVRSDVAALAGYEGPKWTADRLHLLRSHLGPHPRHDVLESWRLD